MRDAAGLEVLAGKLLTVEVHVKLLPIAAGYGLSNVAHALGEQANGVLVQLLYPEPYKVWCTAR